MSRRSLFAVGAFGVDLAWILVFSVDAVQAARRDRAAAARRSVHAAV